MAEEIRPASVNRPRRVRPLSRDERDERGENRDRFSRDLADLAREDSDGARPRRRPGPRTDASEPLDQDEETLADGPEDDTTGTGLGRNLDITT